MSDDIEVGFEPALGDNVAFACQLLQLASERALAIFSHTVREPGDIARWIRQNASSVVVGVLPTDIRCDDDLATLRWLLDEVERPADASIQSRDRSATSRLQLKDAIHRAINLLSVERSFNRAVECAAKRQIYNLAYGLTHEINNPLGNIVARAQQMIGSAPAESDKKSLATIVDQAMRAHEMLAEVMRAVQPSPLQLAVGDVNAVVQSVWDSLRQQALGASIQWRSELGLEPIYARIDTPSLTEVLRLIGRNALDVCGPNDSVSWSCVSLPRSDRTTSDADTLGRVRITVQDTGPGLSPHSMQSALDLFFSGREQGRGLGVSLAVVHRIVDSHSGNVRMRSESSAGCVVEIDLPLATPPTRQKPGIQL